MERSANVEFCEFFKLIKPVLGKYRSNADLLKNMFSMITVVDFENDPLKELKLSNDTLKAYANGNRKIPPELARAILPYIDTENFAEAILTYPEDVIIKLANDFRPHCPSITVDNFAQEVGEIIFNIIYEIATGRTPVPVNVKQRVHSRSYLKHKFGNTLLVENKGICPAKGCGKPLNIMSNGQTNASYDIVAIDPEEGLKINNLIALCPECAKKYNLSHTDDDEGNLFEIKMSLEDTLTGSTSLAGVELEKSIVEILDLLCETKPDEMAQLSYVPVEISRKIKSSNQVFLRKNVNNITQYYPFIKENLQSFSSEKKINYEKLSMQIRYAYYTAQDSTVIQEEVFNLLVEWLMGKTKKYRDACEIIISYFIQTCEVFDDFTK